jgi:hypothetical protein
LSGRSASLTFILHSILFVRCSGPENFESFESSRLAHESSSNLYNSGQCVAFVC